MSCRKYTTIVEFVDQNYKITVDGLCNGWTVVNRGNTNLIVNAELIPPGQAKAVGGNRDEIYVGRIDIQFSTQGITPPFTNAAYVTQKVYIDKDVFDKLSG